MAVSRESHDKSLFLEALISKRYRDIQRLFNQHPELNNSTFDLDSKPFFTYAKEKAPLKADDKAFNALALIHSPEEKEFTQMTPMHYAAFYGDIKMLMLLLANGENIHTLTMNVTALELAEAMGHEAIVNFIHLYKIILRKSNPVLMESLHAHMKQIILKHDEETALKKINLLLAHAMQRFKIIEARLAEEEKHEREEQKEFILKETPSATDNFLSDIGMSFFEFVIPTEIKQIPPGSLHKKFEYLINQRYPDVMAIGGICEGLLVNAMIAVFQTEKHLALAQKDKEKALATPVRDVKWFNEQQKIIFSYFEHVPHPPLDLKEYQTLMAAAEEKLLHDIAQAQLKKKKADVLSPTEENLLTIPAFLETTAIGFRPDKFAVVTPSGYEIKSQEPQDAIFLIHPTGFEATEPEDKELTSPIVKLGNLYHVFKHQQLQSLLTHFMSSSEFKSFNEPIALHFGRGVHAFTAILNPSTNALYFYDANDGLITQPNSIKELVNQIYQACKASMFNNVGIDIKFYGRKANREALRQALEKWKKSEAVEALLPINTTSIRSEDPISHETLLYLAVQADNIETVRQLLAKGADPNVVSETQLSPLMLAINQNNLKMVELLIVNYADPNLMNAKGETPLLHAAKRGSIEIIQHLLNKGANPDLGNHNGETPLMFAVLRKDQPEILKLFLSYGADPDLQANNGLYSLTLAIRQDNQTGVDLLLQHNVDPFLLSATNNAAPLHFAVQYGSLDMINQLIERMRPQTIDAPAIAYYDNFFIFAQEKDKLAALKTLFPYDDINIENFTPLHLAIYFGYEDKAKALLDKGSNVYLTARQKDISITALEIAEKMGHTAIVTVLKKHMETKAEKKLSILSTREIDDPSEALTPKVTKLRIFVTPFTGAVEETSPYPDVKLMRTPSAPETGVLSPSMSEIGLTPGPSDTEHSSPSFTSRRPQGSVSELGPFSPSSDTEQPSPVSKSRLSRPSVIINSELAKEKYETFTTTLKTCFSLALADIKDEKEKTLIQSLEKNIQQQLHDMQEYDFPHEAILKVIHESKEQIMQLHADIRFFSPEPDPASIFLLDSLNRIIKDLYAPTPSACIRK